MPTLPPLSVQIEKRINSSCIWCQCPVDRRSTRCRRCHSTWVATKWCVIHHHHHHYHQSGWEERKRMQRDCDKKISHKNAKGKGRCKTCDIIHGGNPAAYDMYSHYDGSLGIKERDGDVGSNSNDNKNNANERSVSRQKLGSSPHYDKYRSIQTTNKVAQVVEHSSENRNECQSAQSVCSNNILTSEETFTITATWASGGNCWRDFKIAQSKDAKKLWLFMGGKSSIWLGC